MSDFIKLFFIAIVIVLTGAAITIFTVPSVKNKIFPPEEKEEIQEEVPDNTDDSADLPQTVTKDMSARQVFLLAQELKRREMAVREQEERIKKMQFAIDEEKRVILEARTEVLALHEDISQYIKQIDEGEMKNVKKLARMFETMSSVNANPIIDRMPDETFVKVLSMMKPRNSAKILSGYAQMTLDSSKRAARITEKLKNFVVP